MRSLRFYLILFGVLASLAFYFYLNRKSGSYSLSKQEFSVRDTARIESILITSAFGEVNLSRKGSVWTVNGDPVRDEALRGLHVMVSRLEVEAPVSRTLEDKVLDELEKESTRVHIEMEDGPAKAYRVFYDHVSDASYMILEGSDIAFRMKVRGYRQTNLEELYSSDPRFWRDNIVFQSQPGEIQAISFLNNRDDWKSFHLARNEAGIFEVASGVVPQKWVSPGTESLNQYLGYFNEVRFESYLDPQRDTLSRSAGPDYILNLELLDGKRIYVELFPVSDFNRLYARLARGEEWVVVKYVEIDPLLKEFKYFAGV